MIRLMPYDRAAAVEYAHIWAFRRNPSFYDYEEIGGDCTNFASQCLYAGGGIMNFAPVYGWYYIDGNRKSPSWTGVEFLHRFLTRSQPSVGPAAVTTAIQQIQPGDLVQLSFDGVRFSHTPVVVRSPKEPSDPGQILVAAHSEDSDNRPLSTYPYKSIRYLHVTGIYRPV